MSADIFPLLPLLALFLVVAFILKPAARYTKIPYPTLLVITGLLIAELLIWQGLDTGLRWHNFHWLVFYGLLPLLIYDAAFRLNAQYFFENIVLILLLAIPFMLIAMIITAALLYVGIDHTTGFPWLAALVAATIVSATDPSAVIAVLKQTDISPRIKSILEGEGLLSGTMAFVLLTLFSAVALEHHTHVDTLSIMLLFVKVFSGGIAIGMFVGFLSWLFFVIIKQPLLRGVLSVLSAYGSFMIAEYYLHGSGVIAVLLAGLMLNAFSQKADEKTKQVLSTQWHYQSLLAGALVFLLLGVSIQLALLADQWLAIVIGIGAALVARFAVVVVALPTFRFLPAMPVLSMGQRLLVAWGGLRGAVTVALVLSLSEAIAGFQTIQGIVYGVVIFALLIQAPSLSWLASKINRNAMQ